MIWVGTKSNTFPKSTVLKSKKRPTLFIPKRTENNSTLYNDIKLTLPGTWLSIITIIDN